MQTLFYKLAWFLTPIIFLAFYLTKGEFCFMGSCSGNDNIGMAWGIGAVIVYSTILRLAQTKGKLGKSFFLFLLVLIILLVYFLGKING